MLLKIISFFRLLVVREKITSAGWFAEALKNENNGQYQKAVDGYENALIEIKRNKGPEDLKMKILVKLKILHSVLRYQDNFHQREKANG